MIGIRGTGVYIETDSVKTYVCTCYGTSYIQVKDDEWSGREFNLIEAVITGIKKDGEILKSQASMMVSKLSANKNGVKKLLKLLSNS